jgi:hypothetical protein
MIAPLVVPFIFPIKRPSLIRRPPAATVRPAAIRRSFRKSNKRAAAYEAHCQRHATKCTNHAAISLFSTGSLPTFHVRQPARGRKTK